MTSEDFLEFAIQYLCDIGHYGKFEEFLKEKGFTQDEIDDAQ